MEIQAFAAAVASQSHLEAVRAEQARFSWVNLQEVLGSRDGRSGVSEDGAPYPVKQ